MSEEIPVRRVDSIKTNKIFFTLDRFKPLSVAVMVLISVVGGTTVIARGNNEAVSSEPKIGKQIRVETQSVPKNWNNVELKILNISHIQKILDSSLPQRFKKKKKKGPFWKRETTVDIKKGKIRFDGKNNLVYLDVEARVNHHEGFVKMRKTGDLMLRARPKLEGDFIILEDLKVCDVDFFSGKVDKIIEKLINSNFKHKKIDLSENEIYVKYKKYIKNIKKIYVKDDGLYIQADLQGVISDLFSSLSSK